MYPDVKQLLVSDREILNLRLSQADGAALHHGRNPLVPAQTHRLSQVDKPYIVPKVTKFSYAIDKRYLPVLLPFLLRPKNDGVVLTDDGSLLATFGLFKVGTSLTNITGAHVTRNYRWWTACGVRMSRADDGLTFGTNRDGGVCIHFAERVPSALRRSGHSALTVTVADLNGLTRALGGDTEEPPVPIP